MLRPILKFSAAAVALGAVVWFAIRDGIEDGDHIAGYALQPRNRRR